MSIEAFDLFNGFTREDLLSLSFENLCFLAKLTINQASHLGLSKENLIEFILSSNL